MRRRYDLERSDNLPYTGRKAYAGSGDGLITVNCGFPVRSAAITWSSLPTYDAPFEMSSSSSTSLSTSSSSNSSSSSKDSSSSSSSSLSSGEYENKYCASGCIEPGVDGTYTHTGNYWNDVPIYYNGTDYLFLQLFSGDYYWVIDPVIADETSTLAYQYPQAQTPYGGTWQDSGYLVVFNMFNGACSSSSSSQSLSSSSSSSSSLSSESPTGNVTSSSSSSFGYPASYIVTWTGPVGTPDPTGLYFENGLYQGRPAYQREDGVYWLFVNISGGYWEISNTLGGFYMWVNGTYPLPYIPIIGNYTHGAPTQDVSVNVFASSSSESIGNNSSSSSSYLPDFIVEWDGPTGTPDGIGGYQENGTYNGKPAYQRKDGAYWLFWNTSGGRWAINTVKSSGTALWWNIDTYQEYTPNLGTYVVWVGATQDVRLVLSEASSSSSTSSSSSESSSSESSLTSNEYHGPFKKPRIYIYDYITNGFRVRYENIPEEVGFVEFAYVAF